MSSRNLLPCEDIDGFASARFQLGRIPEIAYGVGEANNIADHVQAVFGRSKTAATIVLIADKALIDLGIADPIVSSLSDAGAAVSIFDDISGEPKAAGIDVAADMIRSLEPSVVIGMGGGSALDIAKTASVVASASQSVMYYAQGANPLPRGRAPLMCIPTTAGTGSEVSATNVFSGPDGRKHWVWDAASKPDRIILDPTLTVSLPPALTAWTGLDAFTHALEACTNRKRFAASDVYAHLALRLISGVLETAVNDGENLTARGQMLLGATYAGIAIDNCGTAIAHNISHALAGLAPIHHGFATALALEATLAWSVERGDDSFRRAADACGLHVKSELPAWFSSLMDRCDIERRLPSAFDALTVDALVAEMRHTANLPMLEATAAPVLDTDLARFADALLCPTQASGVTTHPVRSNR